MNNQIVVVVGADGRILNIEQDGVFRRSNKQNELVALLSYPNIDSVKVNFLRADGIKPNSQYMTLMGEQTFEGNTYKAFSYYLLDYQLYATGPLVVSLDVFDGSLTATTGDFTIDVEASENACGAETPTDPNQFDEAIKALMSADSKLDGRVTALENREQMKVLVDFTVNSETGAGVKYYSDGTTAEVEFPVGSGGTPVIKTEFLNVLGFTAESWAVQSEGGYALAFGPEQTGYADNKYFAGLEQSGSETYEAGTETAPSERTGYYTSADTVFKGSDGSLYITANAPYAGRLITLGGVVFTGDIPESVTYNETTHVLTVKYINGNSEPLQLPTKVSEFENDAEYITQTEFSPVQSRDAVTDLTYNEQDYKMTVDYRVAEPKEIQLPRPGTAERYNATFAATDWVGSAAPWSITITAQTHGKGTAPLCQTFNAQGEQIEFGVQRAGNGDITLYTNEKTAFTITII